MTVKELIADLEIAVRDGHGDVEARIYVFDCDCSHATTRNISSTIYKGLSPVYDKPFVEIV